jgi:hypothetical protein
MNKRWLLQLLDHGAFPAVALALSLSQVKGEAERKLAFSSAERQIVTFLTNKQIQRGATGYWVVEFRRTSERQ